MKYYPLGKELRRIRCMDSKIVLYLSKVDAEDVDIPEATANEIHTTKLIFKTFPSY